jgi:hypothetical protein
LLLRFDMECWVFKPFSAFIDGSFSRFVTPLPEVDAGDRPLPDAPLPCMIVVGDRGFGPSLL